MRDLAEIAWRNAASIPRSLSKPLFQAGPTRAKPPSVTVCRERHSKDGPSSLFSFVDGYIRLTTAYGVCSNT